MICSNKIGASEERSGTITQILLTSNPSRSISTEIITLGFWYLSMSKSFFLVSFHSSSLTSPLALLSMVTTSSCARPSSNISWFTKGATDVSSQMTSILGFFFSSRAVNSVSSLFSFAKPARSINRWPSLRSQTLFRSSRTAL